MNQSDDKDNTIMGMDMSHKHLDRIGDEVQQMMKDYPEFTAFPVGYVSSIVDSLSNLEDMINEIGAKSEKTENILMCLDGLMTHLCHETLTNIVRRCTGRGTGREDVSDREEYRIVDKDNSPCEIGGMIICVRPPKNRSRRGYDVRIRRDA